MPDVDEVAKQYAQLEVIHACNTALHALPIIMSMVELNGMLTEDVVRGLEDAIQKQSPNAAVLRKGETRRAS